MLKFVVSSEKWLGRLSRSRLLSRIVRADPGLLRTTRDRRVADQIISSLFVERARISKETASGRFRDLDRILVERLRSVPSPAIHDVAVSSGITSLDLLRELRAAGIEPRLYISDKFTRGLLVRRGPVTWLLDDDGNLLHGSLGPLLADPLASWRFPVSRLLYRSLAGRPPRLEGAQVETMFFYDPEVLDAVRAGDLHTLPYDVFASSSPVGFDVVRCMNVITRNYFPPDRIVGAVANLRRSLKPGGLLLAGRTLAGGRNEATLFRLRDGRFIVEESVNGGADIQELVVAMEPDSRN